VNVNGSTVLTGLLAVIDTGSAVIVAPQGQAEIFYKAISGAEDASETVGEGFFTCKSMGNESLSFRS
jgi:cathepsin D